MNIKIISNGQPGSHRVINMDTGMEMQNVKSVEILTDDGKSISKDSSLIAKIEVINPELEVSAEAQYDIKVDGSPTDDDELTTGASVVPEDPPVIHEHPLPETVGGVPSDPSIEVRDTLCTEGTKVIFQVHKDHVTPPVLPAHRGKSGTVLRGDRDTGLVLVKFDGIGHAQVHVDQLTPVV